MQNSLYKLFEHKCVCTHPSYNDTNPPCGFLKIPILKSSQIRLFWDSSQNDLVLYKPLPWELTRPSYLRPDLSELRALRHCVDSGAGEDKMSPIKWFEVFSLVNNEYSSHHLLLTSEPLKRQRINVTFTLKWMPIPDLHKCVFIRPNHSWSSFIYRRSEYKGFYESLQIAFPNNVLVSQFRGWSLVCSIDINT